MPSIALHSLLKSAPIQALPAEFSTGDGYIDILAAPYGGAFDGKDAHSAFFSTKTDFHEDMIPVPALFYWHGRMSGSPIEDYGQIVHRWRNEDGVWFRVKLDTESPIGKRLWAAAKTGKCFASTGVVPASYDIDKQSGEILSWLIGDLTLIDEDISAGRIPANYYAIAKPALSKLMLSVVPEDRRELFGNVYLQPPTELTEGETEEFKDTTMKRDLLKVKAYLAAAADALSSVVAGMEGDDGDPINTADALEKCAECQGKQGMGNDEESTLLKTQMGDMTKTIATLRADIAAREHGEWVRSQINAGKVQPAEKESLIKTLSTAYSAGSEELIKTVMSMVEARNPVQAPVNAENADGLKLAGFDANDGQGSKDEKYLATLRSYLGKAAVKGGI